MEKPKVFPCLLTFTSHGTRLSGGLIPHHIINCHYPFLLIKKEWKSRRYHLGTRRVSIWGNLVSESPGVRKVWIDP